MRWRRPSLPSVRSSIVSLQIPQEMRVPCSGCCNPTRLSSKRMRHISEMWLILLLATAAPTPAMNDAGVWSTAPLPNSGSIFSMAGGQSRTEKSITGRLCFSPVQRGIPGPSCLRRRGAACPSRPPVVARPTGTPRETLLPCASSDTGIDAYSVLGVRPRSSAAEIKAAFRRSSPRPRLNRRRRPHPTPCRPPHIVTGGPREQQDTMQPGNAGEPDRPHDPLTGNRASCTRM